MNDNRNPGVTRAEIGSELERLLGVRNIIWLSGAPKDVCDAFGDVTDWHVDIAARFTDRSTVLYCWTEDRNDPRYPYLVRHLEQLSWRPTRHSIHSSSSRFRCRRCVP